MFLNHQKEDTYFAKISTCIENEAIAGMLTNKLTFSDDSYRMLINADDKLFDNKENFRHAGGIELSQKDMVDFYKAKSIECKNLKLCSDDLRSFRFIGWNLETNDEITKLVESISHAEEDSAVIEAHRFDAQNMHTSHLNASIGGNGQSQHSNLGIDVDVDVDFQDVGGCGSDFDGKYF